VLYADFMSIYQYIGILVLYNDVTGTLRTYVVRVSVHAHLHQPCRTGTLF